MVSINRTILTDNSCGIYFFPGLSEYIDDVHDCCTHKKFSIWIKDLHMRYADTLDAIRDIPSEYFPEFSSCSTDVGFDEGEIITSPSDITENTIVTQITFYWENQDLPPEFSNEEKNFISLVSNEISNRLRITN